MPETITSEMIEAAEYHQWLIDRSEQRLALFMDEGIAELAEQEADHLLRLCSINGRLAHA
jgi:hypothetical protein